MNIEIPAPKTMEEFAALPVLPMLPENIPRTLSGACLDGDSICIGVVDDDVWEPVFTQGRWHRKEIGRIW